MQKKVVPMFHVPDVRRTVEWYRDVGFEVTSTYGNDGDGLSFAIVSFGGGEVMFSSGGAAQLEASPRGRSLRVRRGLALCLGALALLCWVVMFLAGTDVWHDLGRPDLWNLQAPPSHDLRAFAAAFYLLLIVLAAQLLVTTLGLVTPRTGAQKGG